MATKGGSEPTKKKRKTSILERLGSNDASADDADSSGDSDGSPAASSNDEGDREKGARESASTLKKRTIRDFYSLSPKQPNTSTSPRVSAAKKEVTPKKRVVGKFIGLNDEVAPIHVHVPFRGQDTHIFAIDAHCIDSKYDVSDRPVVLTGTFHGRLNVPIERFLRGFGRYIH